MEKLPPNLAHLLARGDVVAVTHGRLTITPGSRKPVPSDWLADNSRRLIAEAAGKAAVLALEYLSYSTGNYGSKRHPGVTLQFCCLASGESHYVIFNAVTRKSRTTKNGKTGDPLPKGQFSAPKGSAFFDFWKRTELPFHRRSDFHDYMGNLRKLVFTATIETDNRLNKQSLRPLNITGARLTASIHPDNIPTILPDSEVAESEQQRGFQAKRATGQICHGNTKARDHDHKGNPLPPHEQSNDEWLNERFG